MKISSSPPPFFYVSPKSSKKSEDSENHHHMPQDSPPEKQFSSQKEPPFSEENSEMVLDFGELSLEQLKKMVDDFTKEIQKTLKGFQTIVQEESSLWNIILKDPCGKEIRRWNPTEFFQMIAPTKTHGLTRGKILDQKL